MMSILSKAHWSCTFPHAFVKHNAIVSLAPTNVLTSLTTYQTNKQSEVKNISLHNAFLQRPKKEQRYISKKSWSAVMQLLVTVWHYSCACFADSCSSAFPLHICSLSCFQMLERLKGGKREQMHPFRGTIEMCILHFESHTMNNW